MKDNRITLDLTDPIESQLAEAARRIGLLLSESIVSNNKEMSGSLDDFLGTVFSLIQAKHYNFQDRTNRQIDIKPVGSRALQIGKGKVKTDGLWVAGFYFNNALFRIAAVYHRVLKIVTSRDEYVPSLQKSALSQYSGWDSTQLFKVHRQVNELKHDPSGVFQGRKVNFVDALTAINDLLDLIEAWAKKHKVTPRKP